jgi:hypothetical protein
MKRKMHQILGLTAVIILPVWAAGQKPVMVQESNITFSHGEYPGLVMTIPEVDQSVIEKEWIKRIEKKTKSNIVAENGELSIFGALVEDIYESPVNIFSRVKMADSAQVLEVTIELKPKQYMCSAESMVELTRAKNYLFEFGRDQYAAVAKEQLKIQEKTLSILEQKLETLYSNKTKLEKSIVDSKNKIQQNQDYIVTLKNDLVRLNEQLNAEKAALSALTNEESIKQKESDIKTIEKDIKRATNHVSDDEAEIASENSSILTAESDITSNLSEQANVKYQTEVQKNIVSLADRKYNTIINSTLIN